MIKREELFRRWWGRPSYWVAEGSGIVAEKPPCVGCCPYQVGLLGISTHTCSKVLQMVANLWEEVPALWALRADVRGWWIPR